MKFISLFAGIGGLDLGLERAGMECVAQVEINEFALKVLQKHWSNVPKFKDVRDVGKENLPTADLICGGFPCQDVSLIGQRAGLEGKRSTLWSEFYRIVCEIRPRWVVIENVTGLFTSDDGRFFTKILWELSKVGYYAEWDTVPASAFGAPHRRDRVFIVAYSKSGGLQGSGQSEISPRSSETWIFPQSPRVYFDSRASRWSNESRVPRILNGVSNRVDRIKSTGNAVVPDVAEFIGNCVKKAEARLTKRALLKRKVLQMQIKYSEKVKGNSQNYNWAVRFDSDHGYLGISQYHEDGSHKERVLLSPAQVKALQEFLQANTACTRRAKVGAQKVSSNKKGSAKPARG